MNANVKNDYNKEIHPRDGMTMLLLLLLGEFVSIAGLIGGCVILDSGILFPLSLLLVIFCAIMAVIVIPILLCGLKTIRPNEAYVLTLFGEYYGTLYGPGFFHVNPFASAINPASENALEKAAAANAEAALSGKATTGNVQLSANKRVSLKEITLTNDKQKINDQLGNPVIIGT
ncbi:MAG: SPFH domain-containing protein, partial [Oscillospiraceae bacterium]|nr:SPFH domain-containing protein [Oscillospiraceae bacterium]